MTKKSRQHHKTGDNFNGHHQEPGPDKEHDSDKEVLHEDGEDSPDEQSSSANDSTITELKDKHLRLLAEFDNYKKRTNRERLEMMASASREVIQALLPVLDDFDRAKKSADEGSKGEHWSEGVNLVYSRLYNVLQSFGLKAMESTGQAFDPDLHEALTEIPAPSPESVGLVVDTVQKGYMLNDKIIRHAKVVVGK